jgi:DNA polymerase-3 subunit delta
MPALPEGTQDMITTLTGPNSYLIQTELHKIRNDFVSKFGDVGLEQLDGDEATAERLIEAVQSLAFLAPKKLVVLRNPSTHKSFTESIETILSGVPETSDIIIIEPKFDKRSSYYKVLKTKTEFKEYTELDRVKLNNWIVQYAKERKGQISLNDAHYLVERVGQNQQLLASEINKLLTFSQSIDQTNIDLLTDQAPQGSIFELLDAAFSGRQKRAISLYRQQRALKTEPQQIIAMIAWQLHVLALVVTAGNRSSNEIAREAHLNPFVVQKTMHLAKNLSLVQVKGLVARALDLDIKLKSQTIDVDDALQHFLLTLNL